MEKHFELTREEAKIINLMTEGYTIQEIAERMNIEKHIVGHRTFALRKRYNCKSTIQLVARILREDYL